MRVVVDIPEGLLERVRVSVDEGTYEDTREFVSVALENQVELELANTRRDELITIEEAVAAKSNQSFVSEHVPGGNHSQLEDSNDPLQLLDNYSSVQTVESPAKNRLDGGPLWGQYNRIFPVKLTIRALSNQFQQQTKDQTQDDADKLSWIPLDQFSETTADIGREYGLLIQGEDEAKSRGQGQKLSAALPVGDDPKKSKDRFKTHFVGYAEQGGKLTGAAPHHMFVNIPGDSPGIIGITDKGLEFAELWNPLIDGDVSNDQSLSNDEVAFYLQHIREDLPAEFDAMLLAAKSIKSGENRPESLSAQIASLNDDWSDAQASTVRSGLISRMYELGLVKRERVGQRGVAYRLTGKGEEVFNADE